MQRLPFASILGAMVLWSGLASAATYTTTAANLRNSPVVAPSTLVRTLAAGTQVAVVGEKMMGDVHWVKVTDGNDTGWVRADLVGIDPPAPAPPAPQPAASQPAPTDDTTFHAESSQGVTVTAANLRSSPHELASTLIRTLPSQASLDIAGSKIVRGKRWLKVNDGPDGGWIRADLVREGRASVETQVATSGKNDALEKAAAAADAAIADAASPAVSAPDAETLPGTEAAASAPSAPPPPPAEAVPPKPQVVELRAAGDGPHLLLPSVENALASGLSVPPAEAAVTVPSLPSSRSALPWTLQALRNSQVVLAAIVLSLVFMRFEYRLEQRLTPDDKRQRLQSDVSHLDQSLANEGIRREYDRLLGSVAAIEHLLLPKGNAKSALAQLTEQVASVNTTTDTRERLDGIVTLRKRMLEFGVLPAFSRAFDGLPGFAFTNRLAEQMNAFLTGDEIGIEGRFEEIREATKLCFDDLARRLVPDILQGGALTFLFSRRLDLLDAARGAAQGAASRGWTARDVAALRQAVVRDLFGAAQSAA